MGGGGWIRVEWNSKCGGSRAGENTEALCNHYVFRKL